MDVALFGRCAPAGGHPTHGEMSATRTASTCHPPEMVRGTHVFEIVGYSKHRGMGVHSFVRSGVFSVAGHQWAVFLYPDGYGEELEGFDFVSAYLHLLTTGAKVRASCDLRLVDQDTGASTSAHPALVTMRELGPDDGRVYHCMMMQRGELEGTYVKHDRLAMECVVTVRKEPRVSKTRAFPRIKLEEDKPSSSCHCRVFSKTFVRLAIKYGTEKATMINTYCCMIELIDMLTEQIDVRMFSSAWQLADLLERKEGADVTFSVSGETFAAHRLVLAMRSPVFKAELFGPMSKEGTQHIVIEDMQPGVFKIMLYFIYTDILDGIDDGGHYDGEKYEIVRHLLVAADRYDIERLKLLCQSILCNNLDVRNVATTLALADQHHCRKLKNACIEFMDCSGKMEVIVGTNGYRDLARTSPSILADAMVRMGRCNKKLMRRALQDGSESG
ncbi:hypothetical protein ACP70R_003298 [Stipagrostis hirtigluma subsp. patula]